MIDNEGGSVNFMAVIIVINNDFIASFFVSSMEIVLIATIAHFDLKGAEGTNSDSCLAVGIGGEPSSLGAAIVEAINEVRMIRF